MDDIEQKRQALFRAYPASGNWAKKVKKMSPEQVVAIYLRLKAQGKLR